MMMYASVVIMALKIVGCMELSVLLLMDFSRLYSIVLLVQDVPKAIGKLDFAYQDRLF